MTRISDSICFRGLYCRHWDWGQTARHAKEQGGNEMTDEKRSEVALNHARECWKFHSENRNKHFHYFVLVTAALIVGTTGILKIPNTIIGIAGLLFVVAFFILDRRERMLHEDAKQDLLRLEAMFGLQVHASDETPARKQLRKWVSTTTAYRSLYVAAACFFVVIALLGMVPSAK